MGTTIEVQDPDELMPQTLEITSIFNALPFANKFREMHEFEHLMGILPGKKPIDFSNLNKLTDKLIAAQFERKNLESFSDADSIPLDFFHGTPVLISDNILMTRPSSILDNELAVFATPDRNLALLFAAPWNDDDLNVGYVNGILTIEEMYPDALVKIFKNKSGYVATVRATTFSTDKRLGMQTHEFISKVAVPVLKQELIQDLYTAIMSNESIKKIKKTLVLPLETLLSF